MSAKTIWYRRPYPFFHSGIFRWRNALFIIVLGFLFDFLFEPFNVNRSEHLFPYWAICLIHSGGAATMYVLVTGAGQYLINEDDWTIGRELQFLALLMLCIGLGNFGWREVIYNNSENQTLKYLVEEVRNTFLVGSLILFLITMINAHLLERSNQQQAPMLQTEGETRPKGTITLETAAANDSFTLHPNHILCIKSDGNYLEVFQYRENMLHKDVIRLTLQEAAQQLELFPNLLKTHRAYLVNLDRVTKATGNAQGYQLEVANLPFTVPVTRKHLPAFREALPSA